MEAIIQNYMNTGQIQGHKMTELLQQPSKRPHDWTDGRRERWMCQQSGGWMVGQMKRKMDQWIAECSARVTHKLMTA